MTREAVDTTAGSALAEFERRFPDAFDGTAKFDRDDLPADVQHWSMWSLAAIMARALRSGAAPVVPTAGDALAQRLARALRPFEGETADYDERTDALLHAAESVRDALLREAADVGMSQSTGRDVGMIGAAPADAGGEARGRVRELVFRLLDGQLDLDPTVDCIMRITTPRPSAPQPSEREGADR